MSPQKAPGRKALDPMSAVLAQAVHDWRQPLQMAIGYVDLALARDAERLSPENRQGLQQALAALERLRQGFIQVLDYARSGTLVEAQDVDLQALVDRVERALQPDLDAVQGRLDKGPLPTVHADALLLERVVQNLVSNAIKYRGRGPPRIRVWAQVGKLEFQLNVADNGIGLAPEQLATLGQPFRRFHPGVAPGLGLGLASAMRIARSHGGRLWAESGPAGSTFHVAWPRPRARKANINHAAKRDKAPPVKRKKTGRQPHV